MPKFTEFYGYYAGDYYGRMPDGRMLRCETEREYHRLFDEELREIEALIFSHSVQIII